MRLFINDRVNWISNVRRTVIKNIKWVGGWKKLRNHCMRVGKIRRSRRRHSTHFNTIKEIAVCVRDGSNERICYPAAPLKLRLRHSAVIHTRTQTYIHTHIRIITSPPYDSTATRYQPFHNYSYNAAAAATVNRYFP